MRDDQGFIERRILTGLIVSKDYIDRIHKFWQSSFLESPELRKISTWCLEHYRKYGDAPDENIQSIYMSELSANHLSKAEAAYIEEVLAGLSDEYGRGTQFNAGYLYDRTVAYCKKQELKRHNDEIQDLIDSGEVEKAEQLAKSFSPLIVDEEDRGLDLSSQEALDRIDYAFNEAIQSVVTYPGALGMMWNEHLVRGGFFSLLSPEKRGKTHWLLEISMRAIRQKSNVAFFQAGDMTESQLLRRICVYIAQKSDKEKYCQERFRPVGDCVFNQLNTCTRPDRNCDHGIFEDVALESFMQGKSNYMNLKTLKEKHKDFPEYEPCDAANCQERRGTVWVKQIPKSRPLTSKQAKKHLSAFFEKYRRHLRLMTCPAGTLTVSSIRSYLDNWERYDGFVPDLIAIDYADLLSADDGKVNEYRHRQDHIWKGLRALSQEKHALVLTATQADADSYKKGRLSMSNFSEDKRKLAHVTAQYGLNQDPSGREKELGILRINEIVVREGEFSPNNEVTVLQDLSIARSFLESFI